MKTKNLKLKTGNYFHFSFLVFCLSASVVGAEVSSEKLDPTNLLMSRLVENSQDVNTPNVPMPQSSFITAANSKSRRQLWQARIGLPKGQKNERSKTELKRIIEQIRSVEFEPEKKSPEPVIVVEPVPTTEPNESLSGTEVPVEKHAEFKLPYEPVTDQTLQMLENLSQHPDQLDNPFELGEVLFLSGYLKEAGVFYQEALNRQSVDETGLARHRAWILFQIGNCLRDDDLPTATKMYRQLITEYPNSPWTDLAKVQDKLIDWYRKDKPRTLIRDLTRICTDSYNFDAD